MKLKNIKSYNSFCLNENTFVEKNSKIVSLWNWSTEERLHENEAWKQLLDEIMDNELRSIIETSKIISSDTVYDDGFIDEDDEDTEHILWSFKLGMTFSNYEALNKWYCSYLGQSDKKKDMSGQYKLNISKFESIKSAEVPFEIAYVGQTVNYNGKQTIVDFNFDDTFNFILDNGDEISWTEVNESRRYKGRKINERKNRK